MSAGKCPYMAKKEDEPKEAPVAPESKCPHSAGKVKLEESKGEEQKCPYLAKKNSNGEGEEGDEKTTKPWKAAEGDKDWRNATTAEFKAHFEQAYNTIAIDVASRQQHHSNATDGGVDVAKKNTVVANLLMGRLGYTQAELDVVGDDVWLMQGTGNPHAFAKIQAGETVVDLGSGFGLDALVAASKVGPTGRVIGVDLAIQEVANALQRLNQRRIAAAAATTGGMSLLQQQLNVVDFRHGDIECPPVNDNTVDVCISNGGFCLVPDKPKSFREIYRMLKPGGSSRMAISCTARRKTLDLTKSWPSCMLVFIPLDEAKSMLEEIGFTDVVVDSTGGNMDVWDEVKRELAGKAAEATTEEQALPECPHMRKQALEKREKVAATTSTMLQNDKITIHTGGNESKYGFLDDMDMNEYFVRVTIVARKP